MLKALARGTLVYGFAQIAARGAQVVTLLALPAFLTPADYGVVQLILTIAIIANFIMPLEVTQGLARFLPGAREELRNPYSASAWWFTVAGSGLCFLVAQALAPQLCVLLFGNESLVGPFRLGLLFILFNALFYFLQNQFRWTFDMAGFVIASLVFAAATSLLTIGLGLAAPSALTGVLAGQVLGTLLAGVIAFVRLRGQLFAPVRRDLLAEMLRFSLPLVPAQIALFTSLYLGRLVLNGMTDLTAVGLFTLASQIAGVASLLVVGLQAALTPLVMKHFDEPATPPLLARLFEGFVAAALLLSLILGLFASELIAFIGKPEYAPAAPLVLVVAPAALAAQFYIFAPGFAIGKRTDRQLLVSLIGAVTSVVSNFVLIHLFGLWGAAFATLVSAGAFTVFWFWFSQQLYPLPIRWLPVLAAVILAGGIFSVPALWPGFDPPLPVKLLLVAALAAALLLFRLVAPSLWRPAAARVVRTLKEARSR